MKALLLVFLLAGIVPASVRAQASGSDARTFEGRSGRASLLDVMGAAAPMCRARTLDLRASWFQQPVSPQVFILSG